MSDVMNLKVLLPTSVLIDQPAAKIVAEAQNGSFCLLPRHIDFVAALVPGVMIFTEGEGTERYLGIDEGTLVKHGDLVRVSTRNAVSGDDLRSLKRVVQERFLELDDRERSARSALARLEAGMVRRFIELRERL